MTRSTMAGGTTAAGTTTAGHGPTSGDVDKKDMWSSMLDGVASGKRLPEKSILVLGQRALKLAKGHGLTCNSQAARRRRKSLSWRTCPAKHPREMAQIATLPNLRQSQISLPWVMPITMSWTPITKVLFPTPDRHVPADSKL